MTEGPPTERRPPAEVLVFDASLSTAERMVVAATWAPLVALGIVPALMVDTNGAFGVWVWCLAQLPLSLIFAWKVLRRFQGRNTLRKESITFGAAAVRIAGRRIRSKDVLGASTALPSKGVVEIALLVRGQSRPIFVRTAAGEVATAIQAELGLGQRDANMIAWDAGKHPGKFYLGATLALMLHVVLVAILASSHETTAWPFLFMLLAVVPGWVLLSSFLAPRTRLTLSASGVHLDGVPLLNAYRNGLGVFIPYSDIEDVERIERTIRIGRRSAQYASGILRIQDLGVLSIAELDHIVAQIRTAVRRANGDYEQRGTLEDTLSAIERRSTTETWLAQLASLEQTQGQGYRGTVLDREALLHAASDPDLSAEARFAAARLLRRDPEARVRIEAAAARARIEPERLMLRVALSDDVNEADVDKVLGDLQHHEARYRRGFER